MNSVNLIGRLTRDPEVRYSGEMPVANFSIAIDRPPRKDGTKETDFPRCVAFGKTAEIVERYARKGSRVGVAGKIQTGSDENQNGERVYTTDVVADKVDIIDWPEEQKTENKPAGNPYTEYAQSSGWGNQPRVDMPGTYDSPFVGDPGYGYGRR